MDGFVVREWHIVVLVFTLVLNLVKAEISSALNSLVLIYEQRGLIGKTVLLLAADGSWKTVKIDHYQGEIPFVRSGGVFISHCEQDNYIQEKISFNNWKGQRIRMV